MEQFLLEREQSFIICFMLWKNTFIYCYEITFIRQNSVRQRCYQRKGKAALLSGTIFFQSHSTNHLNRMLSGYNFTNDIIMSREETSFRQA